MSKYIDGNRYIHKYIVAVAGSQQAIKAKNENWVQPGQLTGGDSQLCVRRIKLQMRWAFCLPLCFNYASSAIRFVLCLCLWFALLMRCGNCQLPVGKAVAQVRRVFYSPDRLTHLVPYSQADQTPQRRWSYHCGALIKFWVKYDKYTYNSNVCRQLKLPTAVEVCAREGDGTRPQSTDWSEAATTTMHTLCTASRNDEKQGTRGERRTKWTSRRDGLKALWQKEMHFS